MNGITIKNISKSFQLQENHFFALQNISFQLEKGKITVVLGKSGSGKTTLLRLIAGLEKSTEGEIQRNGNSLSVVFQTPRLLPWKNVTENIQYAKPRANDKEIQKCIDTVKLRGFETAYPSQLSGGMQSRVAIARALLQEPDFLLLDEPFSALDVFTKTLLQKELLELRSLTGCGIFFVTHNLEEALFLADEIIVIQNASLIETISLEGKEHWSVEEKEQIKTKLFLNIQGGF